MLRTSVTTVVFALITSLAGAVPAAAAEDVPGGVPGVRVPVLHWTPCNNEGEVGFECATADLPLDYRNPRGATTAVVLTRHRANDPAGRIGSLFVNPGGPGAGADRTVRNRVRNGPAEWAQRFDIVGFDPRGTGRSSPLNCQTPRDYADTWEGVTARPAPDGFDRAVKLGKQFDEACMRNHAALLPFIGTEYVARDMDMLRAAVGDDKLSYFGVSYGTFIGTVYASLFPGKTRALALDGAYDPETYANNPYRYDGPQYIAADAALGRFFDWCEQNAGSCAFGKGDPRTAYLALQAELDEKPIRDGKGQLVANGATLTLEVIFALGNGREFWPTLAQQLINAQSGTGDLLLDITEEAEFLGRNIAIECADRAFPRSEDLMRSVLQLEASDAPLNGPALAYGPPSYDHGHAPACVPWPAQRLSRYAGPFDARGSATILVVGNTGDPDTPYQDAVTLSRTLANAQLLTLRGGEGHTGFFHSDCIKAFVTEYVVNGTLPDHDCTAEKPNTHTSHRVPDRLN